MSLWTVQLSQQQQKVSRQLFLAAALRAALLSAEFSCFLFLEAPLLPPAAVDLRTGQELFWSRLKAEQVPLGCICPEPDGAEDLQTWTTSTKQR